MSVISCLQEIQFVEEGPETEVYCDSEGWTVFQSRGQFGNEQVRQT
jgi:hypothetical protein